MTAEMIRECHREDAERMYRIINEAARAYEGRIPADCYHQPYMPMPELMVEMARMTFYGCDEGGLLAGVMGSEPIKDVTLLRHAYILTGSQRQGIGGRLLHHLIHRVHTPRLLVGTWADAWAVDFYLKHGFLLLPDKDRLLRTYWDISPRQIETSIVLGIDIPPEAVVSQVG
jgi:GNAT superfamily N-acetyltransferase